MIDVKFPVLKLSAMSCVWSIKFNPPVELFYCWIMDAINRLKTTTKSASIARSNFCLKY